MDDIVPKLAAELAAAEARCVALRDRAEGLTQELVTSAGENARLRAVADDRGLLATKVTALQEELLRSSRETEEARTKIVVLENVSQENEQLKREVSDAMQNQARLTEAIRLNGGHAAHAEELATELDAMRQKFEAAEKEIRALHDARKCEQEKAALDMSIERRMRDSLGAQLHAAKISASTEIQSLRDEIASLQASAMEQEQQLHLAQAQLAENAEKWQQNCHGLEQERADSGRERHKKDSDSDENGATAEQKLTDHLRRRNEEIFAIQTELLKKRQHETQPDSSSKQEHSTREDELQRSRDGLADTCKTLQMEVMNLQTQLLEQRRTEQERAATVVAQRAEQEEAFTVESKSHASKSHTAAAAAATAKNTAPPPPQNLEAGFNHKHDEPGAAMKAVTTTASFESRFAKLVRQQDARRIDATQNNVNEALPECLSSLQSMLDAPNQSYNQSLSADHSPCDTPQSTLPSNRVAMIRSALAR